jgi:hypothetical protein
MMTMSWAGTAHERWGRWMKVVGAGIGGVSRATGGVCGQDNDADNVTMVTTFTKMTMSWVGAAHERWGRWMKVVGTGVGGVGRVTGGVCVGSEKPWSSRNTYQ